MIPNNLQTLSRAFQRDTERLRSKLQVAAAACIEDQDAEWWGACVLPDGRAFLSAEEFIAPTEDIHITNDPATAANFLLLVSFAMR